MMFSRLSFGYTGTTKVKKNDAYGKQFDDQPLYCFVDVKENLRMTYPSKA